MKSIPPVPSDKSLNVSVAVAYPLSVAVFLRDIKGVLGKTGLMRILADLEKFPYRPKYIMKDVGGIAGVYDK